MKYINRFAEPALAGVVILLILMTVLVNVAPHLGFFICDIGSGSMSPTLKVGTMVIGGRVEPSALQAGDIIVFKPEENNRTGVCHRIVEVLPTQPVSFRTKGDNTPFPDTQAVEAFSVVGKVTFHLPLLGHFVQFIKSAIGLVLCLILPCVIIIAICVRAIGQEVKRVLQGK